jgi:hypothetical protein
MSLLKSLYNLLPAPVQVAGRLWGAAGNAALNKVNGGYSNSGGGSWGPGTPIPTPTNTGANTRSTSSSRASAAYDPYAAQRAAQAAQQAAYIDQSRNLINLLNNTYDGIYGRLDDTARSQRGTLETQYGQQRKGLTDQFEQNMRILPWQYAARGTADSSFNQDAQADAGTNYNNNLDSINQDEGAKLNQLAQTINQEKTQYHSAQDILNTQYSPHLDTLASPYFIGNLTNQLQSAQTAAGGYGDSSEFMGKLQAIAPSQNQGAAQLQKQLSDLANSSISQFAKDQVASGYIKSNVSNTPNDQNYWLNYYSGLNKGGGVTPQV